MTNYELRGEALPQADDIYQEMVNAAVAIPPGAEGLFFSPHLGGRICPATPEMRGAWLGFSWGHTRVHFFRAVLESIAYEYAWYLRILGEYIPNLELAETRAVGGGARSDEWNGIKELNTPVPWPVWFFLSAAALFAIVYWVLMPAWPIGRTYTHGLLGIDQRTEVMKHVKQADQGRAAWTDRIAALDIGQIRADPGLMEKVREDGRRVVLIDPDDTLPDPDLGDGSYPDRS